MAIKFASFAIPLVVGSVVKALYDIGLYVGHRSRPAEDERTGAGG